MKNFKRDGGSGGFKKFGGKKFGGGNKSFGGNNTGGRPFLYQATCSKCGNDCMLPFKPNGSKPVFCSNCFATQKEGGESQNRSGGHNYTKTSFGDKPMFQTICAKCGDKCEVPFRPVNGKPAYCKQCFDKGGNTSTMEMSVKSPDQFKNQFEALNAKLDKILKMLTPATSAIGAKKEKMIDTEMDEMEEAVEMPKKKSKVSVSKTKGESKKVVAKKKK
jgi:CxxC-x17-CxxC domain-containing protein